MSNKKNILITGGVGFIGANLAEKLIDQDTMLFQLMITPLEKRKMK